MISTGIDFTKLLDEKFINIEKYIKSLKLSFLGSGSSRTVYKINNRLVLKIAQYNDNSYRRTNTLGKAQNKVEYENFIKAKKSNCFAKVYYYHPKFYWLISERCDGVKNAPKRINKEILFELERLDIPEQEYMGRPDAWGRNSKGKLVLIDYGATHQTIVKYYE